MRAPEFWRGPGLVPMLLAPAAALYATAGALRLRLTRPWRAPVPVLCIGNLVAGGSGKTPVAASLAQRLAARGMKPHLVSRGHGGSERGPLRVDPARHSAAEVGDEPLLLARVAPAWIGRDRAAAAAAACRAGAGMLVLDDGLQNPGLEKDLALVVIDAEYGFGNGRVLPAGPLREPVARGLARAHAIVLVGDGMPPAAVPSSGLPILPARLVPQAGEDFSGRQVIAFAGIGRPEKFFATLERLGARLIERHAFADHHRFGDDEVWRIIETASRRGAVAVTTEKDAVRIAPALRHQLRVLKVAAEWCDEAALDGLLARFVLSRRAA